MRLGSVGTTADVRQLFDLVGNLEPAADDAERIERIRLFEELKSRVCAVQAEHAVEFATSQRAQQIAADVPCDRATRGIAAQLGLARRISPWAAARWLGFANIATTELPATHAELRSGRTSEWRAMLVARETALLSRENRHTVDAELAPRLEQLGDRAVESEARMAGYRLDPTAAVRRARRAESDRRVGIRPAPDAMCWLPTLLPVAQGVAAYAALGREADRVVGIGDPVGVERGSARTRAQIMADTLVERITGQSVAADVPVEINIVMTDQALLERDDEPAVVVGHGPIPAGVARDIVYSRPSDTAPRWLRRLYICPESGRLITMDSRRRTFTPSQRHFLRMRDRTCRTPWCDAPIRHADHVTPYADGGATDLDNGEGFCAACNYAKQAPGWHGTTHGDTVVIVTPIGRRYTSEAPGPPGRRSRGRPEPRAA